MNWENLKPSTKINILANESTVEHNLLLECQPLMQAIKQSKSQADCLKIINENF